MNSLQEIVNFVHLNPRASSLREVGNRVVPALTNKERTSMHVMILALNNPVPTNGPTCGATVLGSGVGGDADIRKVIISGGGFLPGEIVDIGPGVPGGLEKSRASPSGTYSVDPNIRRGMFDAAFTVRAEGETSGRSSNQETFVVDGFSSGGV